MPVAEFAAVLRAAKKRLLKLHFDSNTGHIGGNLSCIDSLMVLHHQVMGADDRFILSKGHSAGALYVALWSQGKISEPELSTFGRDDSALPCHPSGKGVPDIHFSTGSLGHGPSLAAGLALAARHRQLQRRVFCMCSDGEWQEGSCWEALTFAVHHRLDNLAILIDQNGLQGFGRVDEVISNSDLSHRMAAFGACVRRVDGHDPVAIAGALARSTLSAPLVVILETVKGRGMHFEDSLESHYLPLTNAQYTAALDKLDLDCKP